VHNAEKAVLLEKDSFFSTRTYFFLPRSIV
jgi:hypothetical protein